MEPKEGGHHYFANKVLSSQIYGFSNSHIWIWELGQKEGWVPKNWCFSTVVLKTLESLLDCKEIQPVHPKGNQSWIFIGRTGVEAETPILWPPDAKNWLIWKEPDAGEEWRWGKGMMREDEMVGWHHRLNGHEFEQAPGDSRGQGNLACCSPWGRKKSDMTERLNWTEGEGLLEPLTYRQLVGSCDNLDLWPACERVGVRGQSCGPEPSTCGIWSSPQADTVRTVQL